MNFNIIKSNTNNIRFKRLTLKLVLMLILLFTILVQFSFLNVLAINGGSSNTLNATKPKDNNLPISPNESVNINYNEKENSYLTGDSNGANIPVDRETINEINEENRKRFERKQTLKVVLNSLAIITVIVIITVFVIMYYKKKYGKNKVNLDSHI